MLQQLVKDLRAEAKALGDSLDSAIISLCATMLEMHYRNTNAMLEVSELLKASGSKHAARFDELICSGS